MQIRSSKLQKSQAKCHPKSTAESESVEKTPSENFSPGTSGSDLDFLGLGLASGVLGVGVPAGLAMGSIKSFAGGQVLLGVGLAAGSVASGAVLGIWGLAGASLSSESGSNAGTKGYLVGAALSTAVAGYATFL